MSKEKETWNKGDRQANYYREFIEASKNNPLGQLGSGPMRKMIHPEEMPWEASPQGRIKHMINEKMAEEMNFPAKSVDLYLQEIPPGSCSGKHRHMSEECVYIIEGTGYDMHWDVDVIIKEEYEWVVSDKGEKYEWEAGDVVYIPINTVHQHFNSNPHKSARIISSVCRVYSHLGFGYNDLVQMEDAPR
ncbi:MAG: cupin domain-containing protein [Syntrophales bacterium LBB04]|nr:cupin domain-containing protein [Syntrophales bacterium LBB04]